MDRHEPGVLEDAQRVAHRAVADAVFPDEHRFDEPCAGGVATGDDPLSQRGGDLFGERLRDGSRGHERA
jgi:hypothetical protein